MKSKFIILSLFLIVLFAFAPSLTTFSAATGQKQNYTAPERPRCVLLEVFTSSTCAPEAASSISLREILEQNESVGGKYTLIKYQMNWPGRGDPYFTLEGGVRKDFYSAVYVPSLYVDNNLRNIFSEFTHQILLDAQSVTAFCEIDTEYHIEGETVITSAIMIPTIDFPANIHLFIAIIEKVTYNNVTTSGPHEFFKVMKKFMPDANGIPLGNLTANVPIVIDQTYTFNGEYRLPFSADSAYIINHDIEHSVENFNNLEVVVWMQNTVTKEVLQSATAQLSNMDQKSVYFTVIGENGNLSAVLTENSITTGTKVEQGSSVTFTAVPDEEYKVKNWTVNGEVKSGFSDNEYTHIVNNNLVVTVEFENVKSEILSYRTDNINIYPNPHKREFTISNVENVKSIVITNFLGQIVKEIVPQGNTTIIINTDQLRSGIYFVTLTFENGNRVSRKTLKANY